MNKIIDSQYELQFEEKLGKTIYQCGGEIGEIAMEGLKYIEGYQDEGKEKTTRN